MRFGKGEIEDARVAKEAAAEKGLWGRFREPSVETTRGSVLRMLSDVGEGRGGRGIINQGRSRKAKKRERQNRKAGRR